MCDDADSNYIKHNGMQVVVLHLGTV